MFEKLGKLIVGLLILGGVVGGIVYLVNREPKREMTPLMYQLAVKTSEDLAQALPRREDTNRVLILLQGPQARDEQQQFRRMLFDAVIGSDKYDARTWDQLRGQLNDDWRGYLVKKLGFAPEEAPDSIEKAAKALDVFEKANIEMQGIVLVKLKRFDEGKEGNGLGAKIVLEAEIYSKAEGEVVARVGPIEDSIESPWDLRVLRHQMKTQSIFWRFPLWFLLACGLPWALIQLVRAVLKRRDNNWNVALLIVFTLLDLTAAWILLFAYGLGGGTIAGMVFVGAFMGYYNYDAVDYIDRRLR